MELADAEAGTESSCPNASYTSSYMMPSEMTADQPAFSPIAWPYIIAGSSMSLFSLTLIYFYFTNIDDKIIDVGSSDSEENSKKQLFAEEPVKEVFWILFSVTLFFFSMSSLQRVYENYIYSLVLCSELAFSVSYFLLLNTNLYSLKTSYTFNNFVLSKTSDCFLWKK